MAKINILESNVYNRIAAGEVVDRPYSVVKEFVENSIDAGAKNITVSIERGGKDLICVSDDGAGSEKKTCAPHFFLMRRARSPGRKTSTLYGRWDSVARRSRDIASVANVRLRSRAAGADEAYELVCSGGKMGEITPCALGAGTEICAENLFFNTPVRAKFLKSDKGEEGDISNFVSRLVLGNPTVAFRYYIDGKLALQSFGGGEVEGACRRLRWQYGAECYKIDAEKHGHPHPRVSRQAFFHKGEQDVSECLRQRQICSEQYDRFGYFKRIRELSDEEAVSVLCAVYRHPARSR